MPDITVTTTEQTIVVETVEQTVVVQAITPEGTELVETEQGTTVVEVRVQGPQGIAGPAGADGLAGENGLSAYEVALENGFVGTEAAWLASLVGPQGPAGPEGDQGPPGADGADGSDATVNATNVASVVHAASAKSPPVDNDEFPIADSAASYGLKKVLWSAIKSALSATTAWLAPAALSQAGATSGQALVWDGSTWAPATIAATPAGSGAELQYRNSGAFGAASVTHYDSTNGRLSIGAGTSPGAVVHAKSDSASEIVGIDQGTTSQTAALREWRNSAGTALARIRASGIAEFGIGFSTSQVWVGDISYPGEISVRGDPSAAGQYGIAYNSSLDGTFMYGYAGRKFVLGTRNYDGTYNARFTFDDASGVKTWTHTDGINYVFGTTTGTKFGTATSQKIGFWNATPVAQPASAAQAAVSGTAGGAYTGTEQTLINDIKTLVNQLRADLVTTGIIKGAA